MSNRDARARMLDTRLRSEKERYEEELVSAERKWVFRYDNQKKRIAELENTVAELRKTVRELREKNNELPNV